MLIEEISELVKKPEFLRHNAIVKCPSMSFPISCKEATPNSIQFHAIRGSGDFKSIARVVWMRFIGIFSMQIFEICLESNFSARHR